MCTPERVLYCPRHRRCRLHRGLLELELEFPDACIVLAVAGLERVETGQHRRQRSILVRKTRLELRDGAILCCEAGRERTRQLCRVLTGVFRDVRRHILPHHSHVAAVARKGAVDHLPLARSIVHVKIKLGKALYTPVGAHRRHHGALLKVPLHLSKRDVAFAVLALHHAVQALCLVLGKVTPLKLGGAVPLARHRLKRTRFEMRLSVAQWACPLAPRRRRAIFPVVETQCVACGQCSAARQQQCTWEAWLSIGQRWRCVGDGGGGGEARCSIICLSTSYRGGAWLITPCVARKDRKAWAWVCAKGVSMWVVGRRAPVILVLYRSAVAVCALDDEALNHVVHWQHATHRFDRHTDEQLRGHEGWETVRVSTWRAFVAGI
jgi:hypothetical protein